jgi:uncharacterized protein (DUF697 family)
MAKVAKSKEPSKKELEALGQNLVNIYETGYTNKKQFLRMSFVKGVVTGFGTIIGATIVFGLLLWLLSFFNDVPLIGDVVNNLNNSVDNAQ